MSFEPFDTSIIVRRLKAEARDLHTIGSAADYAAVKELRGFRTPSAYVVFADEENTGKIPTTFCTTHVEAAVQFGVVLALRNYQEQQGGQMGEEARKLIGQVRTALIGFQPSGKGSNVVAWQAGAVLDYDASVLLFADRYTVPHTLQRAQCAKGC
jgi:hypothetical protein